MNEKYNKDESLAKIKVLISNFYERVGRDVISDVEIEKQDLIDDIDDILNLTKISVKHLVIERLEADDEIKKELKGRWKADGTFK